MGVDDMKKEAEAQAKEATVDAVVDTAVDKAAAAVGPFIATIMPVVEKAKELAFVVGPYVEQAFDAGHKAYAVIEPYHPEEWIPAIIGFILCFYGGAFCTTIAAVEAFRLCGYETSKAAVNKLYDQYKTAAVASEKDDMKDENHDGVADVSKLSPKDLFKRKAKLAFKTCDPDELSNALGGIYAGFMAVVATLQLRFAQVVTLGASLGTNLQRIAVQWEPQIEASLDPEYRRWVPQFVSYATKFIGVAMAWLVQRLIFGFTSAMKGSQMLCRGVGGYLVRHKHVDPSFIVEGSATFNYVETAITAIGFYSQFMRGFTLGWASIFLFPLSTVEFFLSSVIGNVA